MLPGWSALVTPLPRCHGLPALRAYPPRSLPTAVAEISGFGQRVELVTPGEYHFLV
jgi:hypothetical protein